MKDDGRPLGISLFCLLITASGLLLLTSPFLPWPLWKTSTLVLAGRRIGVSGLALLFPLMGLASLAAAALTWRLQAAGLILSLSGLAAAVGADCLFMKPWHALVDLLLLLYLLSKRRLFFPSG